MDMVYSYKLLVFLIRIKCFILSLEVLYLKNVSSSFDFIFFFKSIYFFVIDASMPFVIQGFLSFKFFSEFF